MRIRSRRCKLSRIRRWNGNTSDLETLEYGVSGRVLAIDGFRVIKVPLGSPRSLKDIETEREAYRRLARNPSCPYIAKCYDYEHPRGIIMERLDQTVRRRLRQLDSAPTGDDVVKWALQAARGLAFLHSREIVQADVGCHNMLLDWAGNLKLCDFSGCSIDGKDASVCYEPWSQLPSADMPNKCADIFALGSAIYEMATGHVPHHDLPEYEISGSYEACRFPEDYPANRDVRLWTIIKACWTGDHKTAGEVVTHIEHIATNIDRIQKPKRSLTGLTLVSTPFEISRKCIRSPKAFRTEEPKPTVDANRPGRKERDRFRKWNFCPGMRKAAVA
jgi:serine/threonine protein kinase